MINITWYYAYISKSHFNGKLNNVAYFTDILLRITVDFWRCAKQQPDISCLCSSNDSRHNFQAVIIKILEAAIYKQKASVLNSYSNSITTGNKSSRFYWREARWPRLDEVGREKQSNCQRLIFMVMFHSWYLVITMSWKFPMSRYSTRHLRSPTKHSPLER